MVEINSHIDAKHQLDRPARFERIGIWELDLVTDSFYCSPDWKKMRGCEADVAFQADPAAQFVHPDDLLKREELLAKLRAGELEQVESEHRVKRSDGSWGHVIERIHSVCNNQEHPIRLVGCEFDVLTDEQNQDFQKVSKAVGVHDDSLPIAIVRFDNIQCVYANDCWSRLTGRSKESALGDGWLEALHPDDRHQFSEFVESHSEGTPGDKVTIDGISGRHLNPDGSIHWFVAKLQLNYGMDGLLASSSVVVLDVTERKELEREQERLIEILEATSDFIGISTPDYEMLWRNKSLAELRPDLKPETNADYSLAHPEWSRKIMGEVAIPAAIEHGSWSGKMAIFDLDGNEIPVSQVLITHKGPDGLVESLSTIMRDISEHEKIESALQLSERNYASLAGTAPVGIFRMSDPVNCIYVNENWSKQTGLSLEEARGTGWMKICHPDDLEKFRVKADSFVNDPNQVVLDGYEARQILPDGSTHWVKCHLAKELDDEGNVTGYIGTLTNIDRVKRAEEELKELNERLHEVLEVSSIGIWEWLWEDSRLVWDEKMLEIYGVDVKDFRGIYDDWKDRIHPDDLDRVKREEESFADVEQDFSIPFAQEFRIVRPNGEVRYIYSSVHSEVNEHGTPVRAIGLNVDITDRRETEFALLESENKFQRIADHLPGMVYCYYLNADGTDGWSYVSPQVRELFGIAPEDVVANGKLLWQLVDPDDMVRLQQKMQVSAQDLSRFEEEFRATIPGQDTRWFQANSQPSKAKNGGFIWDGVILEITDRKTAEFKFEEAKLQIERITENVPGVIYQHVLNADGTLSVSFISSQCREFFGLTPQEVMGDVHLLLNKIYPEDAAEVKAATKKSARTLQPLKVEYRVFLPGKGLRWHQSIGQPFRTANDGTVWNGMVLDVTDRKEAELANDVLAKATKTKDEFMANMSHELRTPLTAILAMTDGLQQGMFGDTTPKQKESLKIVEQSGEHLLDLINEVLDLAKIESGQTELEFTYFAVSEMCESCLNFVTQQAEQKQIELSLKVPWNLGRLGADEKRIRQVLINLLSNAVKFTPQGGQVKLDVETLAVATTDLSPETLRISVSDTGIGIQDDQLATLFEPFVQVDSSLTRQHGGTGLGLSLVKQFVELHQGQIHVTSVPGHGSCFTIDLPFRKVHSDQAQRSIELEQRSESEASNAPPQANSAMPLEGDGEHQPLILLAEDNDDVALSIIAILEFSKFNVLRAVNGRVAVEMARAHSPDLILMDIQMPEMDGLEATRQIRSISKFAQLPIIAVSGFAKLEDSQRCIEAGVNLFMAKPLRIKELVSNMNGLLREQKAIGVDGS